MSADVSIFVNGEPRAIGANASVASLLVDLNMSGRPIAVEVNGEVVPRSEHSGRSLGAGDRVEIVTLVGGG